STSGQPHEVVKSCMHMESTAGYAEAKRMLKEFFGDDFKIAEAYIKEALDGPTIKPEDGVSLQSFALFLTGCSNTMTDISYMEDLDNTANIRALANKLPYKLKESWRKSACDLQERTKKRVKFKDFELDKHITKDELALHCRRRTRGEETSIQLLDQLLTELMTGKGNDALGNSANLLNYQIYLLEGLSRWNQDRAAAAVTSEPSTLRTYTGELVHCVNSNYEKVFGRKLIPGFSPPAKYTGELIGVQYLLRQNNEPLQDMHPNSEETSQLMEDLDVEEPKDPDEGFEDFLGTVPPPPSAVPPPPSAVPPPPPSAVLGFCLLTGPVKTQTLSD
ncbi:hypothetical protein D4764_0276950, partial [Takifugu flavidus]